MFRVAAVLLMQVLHKTSEDLEGGGIMRGRKNQIRAGPENEGAIVG
jgi:hypothetical protein